MGVLEQGAAAVLPKRCAQTPEKMGTKTQTLLQSSTPSPLSPILFMSAPHPLAEHHHSYARVDYVVLILQNHVFKCRRNVLRLLYNTSAREI